MFATKKDVMNWIKDFGKDLNLEPFAYGKYWRIKCDDGMLLSEEKIFEIESNALV